MSSIDTRPSFFPRSRSAQAEKAAGGRQVEGAGNSPERAFYFRAKKTLELPVGLLPSDLKVGDILEVTNV